MCISYNIHICFIHILFLQTQDECNGIIVIMYIITLMYKWLYVIIIMCNMQYITYNM